MKTIIFSSWIFSLVACGSSTSPSSGTSEFSCDPPDACRFVSVEERLCPSRSTESKCGDLYKELYRCLQSMGFCDLDATTNPCETQAHAWQLCNTSR